MKFCSRSNDAPLIGEGGIEAPVVSEKDPYRSLDDLMAVVEALCPVWPQREPFVAEGKMLL